MDNTTHDVPPSETEAMKLTAPGEQVAARIGFAERWLLRARAQCEDGNVAGGLLTLSLADAEVRYALEAGGWQAHGTRRWRRVPWVLLAAASAALLVWGLRAVPVPVSAGPTDGPPVVRLPAQVGTLLAMVTVPAAPSSPAPAASVAAPRPTRRAAAGQPVQQVRASMPAPAPSIVSTAPAVVTTTPSPTTASSASVRPSTVMPVQLISDVDLIEMVLAADRTLRGTGP